MRTSILVSFSIFLMLAFVCNASDLDSDHDGLSDFQEIHKYRTNTKKNDSDGDGVPDGDWQERREFTYSVRTVVKVMRPCNTDVVNDDYQDARVLSETKNYVELEVIHYPLNTNADGIQEHRDWKKHSSVMKPYLEPGITTNWDAKMRQDLLAELKAAGIDVDALTDKQVVEKLSRWAMRRGRYLPRVFTTYYIHYSDGQPSVYPGLENAFKREFERDRENYDWKIDQHFNHELLGRGMYYNKTHGSCTSFAVYLTTVLRAAGIPTRMVLAIPVIDSNDQAQLEMAERGIRNHRLRHSMLRKLRNLSGFVAHTFNEVYVGGRWRRLNYSKLGADIDSIYGLITHVNTFKDLSEAELAPNWGRRYGRGERDRVFKTGNPFCTTELSDSYGIHCDLQNPVAREHKYITITRAYWPNSKDAPDLVKKRNRVRPDGSRRLYIHGDEWIVGEPYTQYKDFMRRADPNFKLVAEMAPEVKGSLSSGYFTHQSSGVREIEILIDPEEYIKLKRGVAYKLIPVNANKDYYWKVKKDLRITIED